jgi:tripartite-type tricarboxylate transporter receptor subunit TctC
MWKVTILALILAHANVASAAPAGDAYPTKPVRILDGFAAGGNTDYVGRVIGAKLQERSGQTVLVDNRPGAASTIAGEITARAAPDAHTLFITLGTILSSSPYLYPKLTYDIMKDFDYVTLAGLGNYVMLIHPSHQVKNVAELVAQTKAKPSAFRYGSGGVGSPVNLSFELLKLRTGMQVAHVPYKGGAPAVIATAGGEVDMTIVSVPSAAGMVKSKKLNALAVTGPTRIGVLPDVPTMAESGIPDYQVGRCHRLHNARPYAARCAQGGQHSHPRNPADGGRQSAVSRARHRSTRHHPGRIQGDDPQGRRALGTRDQRSEYSAEPVGAGSSIVD